MSLWEEIRELCDNLAWAPPITAIYAHHSVPWGRRFTQYDTMGRKIVWVNRGELAELPTVGMSA